MVATLRDGSERSTSYHESWGNILSKHVQHRCKVWADGTGVAADLVCADAWERICWPQRGRPAGSRPPPSTCRVSQGSSPDNVNGAGRFWRGS